MSFIQPISPTEFLKNRIYPDLDQALIELIEHVSKTNLITRHQEHLIEQKTLDKIEKKRIEKEKLKKELGSEYESSEESGFEDDFKQNDEAFEIGKSDQMKSQDTFTELESKIEGVEVKASKENIFGTKKNKFGMVVIEEGEELDDLDVNAKVVEIDESTKFEKEMEKRKKEFNPVKFLGECLKRIAEAKKQD